MRNNSLKRAVSILLSFVMVFSCVSFATPVLEVQAEELVFSEDYSTMNTAPAWGGVLKEENGESYLALDKNKTNYTVLDNQSYENVRFDLKLKHAGSGGTKRTVFYFQYDNGEVGVLSFRTTMDKSPYGVDRIIVGKDSKIQAADPTTATVINYGKLPPSITPGTSADFAGTNWNTYGLTVNTDEDGKVAIDLLINDQPSEYGTGTFTVTPGSKIESIGFIYDANPFLLSSIEVTDLSAEAVQPDEPTDLSITAAKGIINVSWEKADNAKSGYEIEMTELVNGQPEKVSTFYAKSDSDSLIITANSDGTPLQNGGEYKFAIKAKNGALESNTVEDSIELTLAAPVNLTATPAIGAVSLTWDGVSDATGYNVYCDDVLSNENPITSTTYTVNVETGKEYHFKVKAVNNAGESEAFSNQVSAAPNEVQVKPAAPSNLKAEPADGKVKLSWDASETATAYYVYVNGLNKIEVGNKLSYEVTGLNNGESYRFAVSASNMIGESDKSVPVTAIPVIPAFTLYSANWFEQVYLQWSKVAGATGYQVYARMGDGDFIKYNSSVITQENYTVLNLLGDVTYDFKVVPIIGGAEAENYASNIVTQTPMSYNIGGFGMVDGDGTQKLVGGTTGAAIKGAGTLQTFALDSDAKVAELAAIVKLREKPATANTPLLVQVFGTIKYNDMLDVKKTANITFVGMGTDAVIDGWGINLVETNNVIIRNITFKNAGDDSISIKDGSHHVIVDHNEFYKGYDGLTDIKNGASYVTVSWNIYHSGHAKTSLVGHSSKGAAADTGKLKTTYHHNWFDGTGSRHPRVRFGEVHTYNNYYSANTVYGAGSALYAYVYSESNYFKDVQRPLIVSGFKYGGSTLSNEPAGFLRSVNDVFVNCGGIDTNEPASPYGPFILPSSYYEYTVEDPNTVPKTVMLYAGVEKKIDLLLPPDAPETASVSIDTESKFNVSWSSVYLATAYIVSYSTNGVDYNELAVVSNSTNYTSEIVASVGSTYYFKVAAVGAKPDLVSQYSPVASIGYVTPSTPTGLVATKINGGFDLSWNEAANATAYEVTITVNGTVVANEVCFEPAYTFDGFNKGDISNISIIARNGGLSSSALSEEKVVSALIITDDLNKSVWSEDFTGKTPNMALDNTYTVLPIPATTKNKVAYTARPDDNTNMALKLYDLSDSGSDITVTSFSKKLDAPVLSGRVSVEVDFYLTTATSSSTQVMTLKSSNGKTILKKTVTTPADTWATAKAVLDLDEKIFDFYLDDECISFNESFADTSAIGLESYEALTPGKNSDKSGQERSIIFDNFEVNIIGESENVNTIKVETMPTKVTYLLGEAADFTGIEVVLISGGENPVKTVITEGLTYSALDTSTPGKKTITVSYEGLISTFVVEVIDPNVIVIPWKTAIFGSGTSSAKNKIVENTDGSVTISSDATAGKFGIGDDAMALQYKELTTDSDFDIVTTVNATSYLTTEEQSSFGLIMRDELGVAGTKTTSNYIAVGILGKDVLAFSHTGKTAGVGEIQKKTSDILALAKTDYDLHIKKRGDVVIVSFDNGTDSGSWTYSAEEMGFASREKLYVGFYATRNSTVVFRDFDLTVQEIKDIASIEITKPALKTTYFLGDSLDLGGLELKANYTDNSNEIIDLALIKISGFNNAVSGVQTITVLYRDKSISFDIEVKSLEFTAINIKYLPTKVSYYLKDEIDKTGLKVEGVLNSGNVSVLNENEYTLSGYDMSKSGTQTVIITNILNPSLTASFTINVSEDILSGIKVIKLPSKTNYFIGESLDLSGIVINAVYNDSGVTLERSEYEVSGFDSATAGFKTVVIKHKGFLAEFIVFVKERQLTGISVTKLPSKTTYYVGEQLELTGLVVSKVYDNGDKEILTPEDYNINTQAYNQNAVGTYEILVIPTGEFEPASFNVSVQLETTAIWKTAIFGQSSSMNYNKFKVNGITSNSIAAGPIQNNVSIIALDGGGKVTASHDGISFYYTEIDAKADNFVISADVKVNEFAKSTPDNQEGFGLMARDSIGEFVSGTQPAYSSNMVYIGGYRGLTQAVMRKGVDKDGGSGASSIESVDLNNGIRPSSSNTQNYKLTLAKTNSGYRMQLNDNEPVFYAESDILTVRNEETIYVGFFAARLADITVSNVKLTTTKVATDEPKVVPPAAPVKPTLSFVSLPTSSISTYKLQLMSNVNGKVTVISDKGQSQGIEKTVKANEVITIVYDLKDYAKTNFTATLIPDDTQNLTSFDKVTSYLTVTQKAFQTEGNIIYVSPDGIATAEGTRENPLDLVTAINFVQSGQTITMLAGTYLTGGNLTIAKGNDGVEGALKSLVADNGANVIVDLGNKGNFYLNGSYWHIFGIDVTNASSGFRVGGSYNTIELCNFYKNHDTGFQISRTDDAKDISDWPSYNLVLNCTSHDNRDASDNNADGFAAKLTSGIGNVFRGCISHNNVDDGWDLYTKAETGAIGAVLIDGCIAYNNGTMSNGDVGKGDKNGFKLGGEGIAVAHTIQNSIAFGNGANGFTSNSNPAVIAINNISYKNATNLSFYRSGNIELAFDVRNFISYQGTSTDKIEGFATTETNYLYSSSTKKSVNSKGVEVTSAFFESLTAPASYSRNADGSIIFGDFLKLKNGFEVISEVGKVKALKAASINNGIKFTWNGVAGAEGYYVEAAYEEGGAFTQLIYTDLPQYTLQRPDGIDSDFIYIRVKAVKGTIAGAYSDVVTGEFVSYQTAAPENVIVAGNSNDKLVTVKWDKVDGADSYIVTVSNAGYFDQIITTNLSWVHSIDYGTYTYSVVAVSEYGASLAATVLYDFLEDANMESMTLAELIEKANIELAKTDVYTEASLNFLRSQVEAAEIALESGVQESITEKKAELITAIRGLQLLSPPDISALKTLIQEARVLANTVGKHTKASRDLLTAALDYIEPLVIVGIDEVTIQQFTEAITQKINNLVLETKPADKSSGSSTSSNSKTIVKANWKQDSVGWWYSYSNGTYPTSKWVLIDNNWYYFNSVGYMVTGWILYNNQWYYTYLSGNMATNWVQVGSKWYYFNANGDMAANTTIGGWIVDENGAWVE